MHNIIFHIAGIALLEICFYFYYIGPIESKMFQNNIIHLLNGPSVIDSNKLLMPHSIQNILTNLTNQEQMMLKKDFTIGKYNREQQNYDLFLFTIKYWVFLLVFGFLIYIIHYKYKQLRYKKTHTDIEIESGSDDNETFIIDVYRKDSIDINDITSDSNKLIPKSIPNSKRNKYVTKIAYYFSFGGCVLLFEYIFFQCIVLQYNPLSISELRYFIYQDFMKHI